MFFGENFLSRAFSVIDEMRVSEGNFAISFRFGTIINCQTRASSRQLSS